MRRGGSSARGLVLAGLVALACSGCGGDWVPSEMDEPIERAVEAVKADELAQFQLLQEQYTDGVDEAEMVELLARIKKHRAAFMAASKEILGIAEGYDIGFWEAMAPIMRRTMPYRQELRARYPVASEHFSVDEWEERYR